MVIDEDQLVKNEHLTIYHIFYTQNQHYRLHLKQIHVHLYLQKGILHYYQFLFLHQV